MAKQTIVTKSINAIRALLLGISILALVTLLIWSYFPATVDSLSRIIISIHEAEYRETLSKVESGTYTSEEKINLLISLLQSLEKTRIEESLGRLKRAAFNALVTELAVADDYDRGLEWVDRWLEYDKNNLIAVSKRIDLLGKIPSRQSDAIKEIEYWYKKAPEVAYFREEYEALKKKDGNVAVWTQAVRVPFVVYYRKSGNKFFETYHGRDYVLTSRVDSLREFEYGYNISAAIDSVRIVFNPSKTESMYSIKRVDISYRHGETPINIVKNNQPHLNNMTSVNGWFKANGPAPYLEFRFDEADRYARKITVYGGVK